MEHDLTTFEFEVNSDTAMIAMVVGDNATVELVTGDESVELSGRKDALLRLLWKCVEALNGEPLPCVTTSVLEQLNEPPQR